MEFQESANLTMEQLAATFSEFKLEVVEQGEVFVFQFLKTDTESHHSAGDTHSPKSTEELVNVVLESPERVL